MSNTTFRVFPPQAVVFDMDGVLIDSRPYHLQAFQELGLLHGQTLTDAEFRDLFGLPNVELFPRWFGRPLAAADITALDAWKEQRYRELIAATAAAILLPGISELLAWLDQQQIPFGVATSAPRANLEQILQATGLTPRLQSQLASEDVQYHKPHPEIYLTSCQRLGAAPDRCWIVEDSLYGLQAGKAAGTWAIGVATTHPAEKIQVAADVVFANPWELWQAVQATNS